MSCTTDPARTIVLDAYAGWALGPSGSSGLEGLGDPGGVTLARLAAGTIPTAAIDARVPPPRLATPDCGATWIWLDGLGRVRVRGLCDAAFREPHWPGLDGRDAIAVAASMRVVVIVFRDAGEHAGANVRIVPRSRGRAAIHVHVARAIAAAIAPSGDIVVATSGGRLVTLDPAGGVVDRRLAHVEHVERIAFGDGWVSRSPTDRGDEELYAFARADAGMRAFRVHGHHAEAIDAAAFERAFPRDLGVRFWDRGFCVAGCGDGGPACFDGDGASTDVPPPASAPFYVPVGTLTTAPIDSGVEACRWHRIELEVVVPAGTKVKLEHATLEHPSTPLDPSDWSLSLPGATDVLVGPAFEAARAGAFRLVHLVQAPGRFLLLRLTLEGDGLATPRLFRILLEAPRATSFDELPEVYREDAPAAEFGERFAALFDATTGTFDRSVERFATLLNPERAPADVLGWLGTMVGAAFDPALDVARRRAWLAAIPELYRRRGTPEGLRLALRLALGVEPLILELAELRAFGTIGASAHLGSVRLFGRNTSRFRLGRSSLGRVALRSYGDPAADPGRAGALRVRISLPLSGSDPEAERALARRIVDAEKPAHVVADVVVGAAYARVGAAFAVGIDSVFGAPPAPVIGRSGTVRLGRASVLRRAVPSL